MELAISAILSIVLGAISGVVTSRLQLPIQTQQQLSLKLFEKRSESYTLLYKLLSDFIKINEFGKITSSGLVQVSKQDAVEFLVNLEEWDSRNAIFLTPYSTGVCYKLRKKLYEVISMEEDKVLQALKDITKSCPGLTVVGQQGHRPQWLRSVMSAGAAIFRGPLKKSESSEKSVMEYVSQLEASIKYDIGAYTIEPFPGIRGFNPVKDCNEAEATMNTLRGISNHSLPDK